MQGVGFLSDGKVEDLLNGSDLLGEFVDAGVGFPEVLLIIFYFLGDEVLVGGGLGGFIEMDEFVVVHFVVVLVPE
jgi:hypothetical protein